MRTTTTYTQRVTITTDDSGERTITRTSYADTLTEYIFSELSEAAQARAIADAIEEEQSPENYYSTHIFFAEDDIWQAARDFTAQQPVRIYCDAGGSPAGEARSSRWAYDAHELVTLAKDTGICYSMDICDKWNEYAPRIMALNEAIEEAIEQRDEHESRALEAVQADEDPSAEEAQYAIYDAIADKCTETAEELTEEAARAVGDMIDGLIEAERDYYTSPAFWREWLEDDAETRYTRDGERI